MSRKWSILSIILIVAFVTSGSSLQSEPEAPMSYVVQVTSVEEHVQVEFKAVLVQISAEAEPLAVKTYWTPFIHHVVGDTPTLMIIESLGGKVRAERFLQTESGLVSRASAEGERLLIGGGLRDRLENIAASWPSAAEGGAIGGAADDDR